jgi:hypothetical protein
MSTQPRRKGARGDEYARRADELAAAPNRTHMRDMRAGTRFVDTYGDIWRRGREHGSHNDVWLATRERDGFESCFGGCACLKVLP